MSKRDLIYPTDEEDAAINRGIAADADNPELTSGDVARMVPAAQAGVEMVPDFVRRRGPQREPVKELVSIRLDRDALDRWRATGPGWQGRMNDVIRKAVE